MENGYAQALWKLVDQGHTPEDAVRRVKTALDSVGRTALLPKIKRAFARIAERAERGKPRLVVAAHSPETEKGAMQKLSLSQMPEITVDETLIGGWRYVESDRMVDTSYKNQLLEIYNRATR